MSTLEEYAEYLKIAQCFRIVLCNKEILMKLKSVTFLFRRQRNTLSEVSATTRIGLGTSLKPSNSNLTKRQNVCEKSNFMARTHKQLNFGLLFPSIDKMPSINNGR